MYAISPLNPARSQSRKWASSCARSMFATPAGRSRDPGSSGASRPTGRGRQVRRRRYWGSWDLATVPFCDENRRTEPLPRSRFLRYREGHVRYSGMTPVLVQRGAVSGRSFCSRARPARRAPMKCTNSLGFEGRRCPPGRKRYVGAKIRRTRRSPQPDGSCARCPGAGDPEG